jgi:F-type H+-transporting ATPase subunit delta
VRNVQIRVSTSGRYAIALFDLANQDGVFEAVCADIENIRGLIKDSISFRKLLSGKVLSKKKSLNLFKDISSSFGFHEMVANFFCVLVNNSRVNLLDKIISDFQSLADEKNGVLAVDLEVFKKHPALLNVVQKALKEKFKSKAYRFNVKENTELMAGFMAFINGKCLDYSLKGRLDRMRNKLKEV